MRNQKGGILLNPETHTVFSETKYVYGVRDPKKHRTVNFDDRKSAWAYARHLGVGSVIIFEIKGNAIRQKEDKKPAAF